MHYFTSTRKMAKRIIINIILLISVSTASYGQDSVAVVPSLVKDYSFIKSDENSIENTAALSVFFEKLYLLKKENASKVNIVQIGDSHIQADFLSHATRQHLQREFGNGGRGLVVPGRIARTNEPSTIYSSTTANWESKRIVYTDKPLPIGIGAISFKTEQPNTKLTIKTLSTTGFNYSFDKVTLFFQKDFNSFNLAVKDSTDQNLAFIGSYTFEAPNTSTIILPYTTRQITFETLQSNQNQKQFVLFGINLEKTQPGLIFHSIGGNGAKFRHYLATEFFFEQTEQLHPDLFIISLGTNEAIEHPYVDPKLFTQITEFVGKLKAANPNALFLLTTPADFYKKRTRRNPGAEIVRNKLIEFATQNNLAYWDLFEIAGGKNSADRWKANSLLQADGIHFTKAGYHLIGSLLYEAIMKGYQEYVQYRYP